MDDLAVKVEHVSKDFKLPHENYGSLKSAIVNFYRRKKGYEIQKALEDISFEIQKGDFFAIVGRNGSGKSTLLKLLAGIYLPTGGGIAIEGRLTPFIELGVGFNPELTGRENIFLNGSLLGFSRKEMSRMYQKIVSFAELERFMDQKLKNYSSGMQVRLAFSIAIRAMGDVLLLDEVLAVGDAAFQQKCYNYFEELKLQKRTVVFVSHDMNAVTRFCNKAIYIKNGKLIFSGTPAEVADLYREENIDNTSDAEAPGSRKNHTSNYQISARISEQSETQATFKINYRSRTKDDLYVGISVIKDGFSIAEITTPPDTPFKGDGTLTYTIDTTLFNGGMYSANAALFRVKNRELLAFTKSGSSFVVKGTDITRGAAVRLAASWTYEKA